MTIYETSLDETIDEANATYTDTTCTDVSRRLEQDSNGRNRRLRTRDANGRRLSTSVAISTEISLPLERAPSGKSVHEHVRDNLDASTLESHIHSHASRSHRSGRRLDMSSVSVESVSVDTFAPTPVPTPVPTSVPTPVPTPMPTAVTCGNGELDGTETDVDCGGDYCVPCPFNSSCSFGTDCQSGVCLHAGTVTAGGGSCAHQPTMLPTAAPTAAPELSPSPAPTGHPPTLAPTPMPTPLPTPAKQGGGASSAGGDEDLALALGLIFFIPLGLALMGGGVYKAYKHKQLKDKEKQLGMRGEAPLAGPGAPIQAAPAVRSDSDRPVVSSDGDAPLDPSNFEIELFSSDSPTPLGVQNVSTIPVVYDEDSPAPTPEYSEAQRDDGQFEVELSFGDDPQPIAEAPLGAPLELPDGRFSMEC